MSGPQVRGSITLKQGEFAMLGELHEHAVRLAEAEFAKAVAGTHPPYQCPFLWLVKTPRVLLTIETPWAGDDEKVRSMQMMRTYMMMAGARSYSFMHEAWMAHFDAPNIPKEMPYSVRALPPDQREDVLLVWTYDHSDQHLLTRYGVKRAGTPKARLLARDDDLRPGHFEGRMFNLLKPPKPMTWKPGDDFPRPPKPSEVDAAGDALGTAVEHSVICPHCLKQNDMASVISERQATPLDGDVMLCVTCGNWSKVASEMHGGARKLTDEESFVLGFDPRLRDVRRAWMDARAELAGKASKES